MERSTPQPQRRSKVAAQFLQAGLKSAGDGTAVSRLRLQLVWTQLPWEHLRKGTVCMIWKNDGLDKTVAPRGSHSFSVGCSKWPPRMRLSFE